jgi:hypothetical protein
LTKDLTNSGASPLSKLPASARELAAVILSLTILIAAFALYLLQHGYILYWGDAQAHLNNSRSILDSRFPGFDQIGTVWLPSLHLLALPFVQNNWLWSTGLAGTIPAAACFIVAGTCFFLAARHVYQHPLSAMVVLCCFALNPNMLYLSAIPMTESVFLAGLAVAFLSILRFKITQQRRYLVLGLCASWFMSLTRYDGWFLIPFVAFFFARSSTQHRWRIFIAFCAAASLVPLCWMANSWWQTGNALDFINGPYSASAIQGDKPYPGWHNWQQAARYYFEAGRLCSGGPLILIGSLGALVALFHKRYRPAFFFFLTPAFYVWSIHSSKTPIHVPTLWPFSYYNTRYGIAVFVFAAFAAGALTDLLPQRRQLLALAVPLLAIAPWFDHEHLSPYQWICWQESNHNSLSRRAWTNAAAQFLKANYHPGDGILMHFGDIAGIFCQLQLPLRESMHDGTIPYFLPAVTATSAYHPMKWAIALHGDIVSNAILNHQPSPYSMVLEIKTKDSPDLEIFKRNP